MLLRACKYDSRPSITHCTQLILLFFHFFLEFSIIWIISLLLPQVATNMLHFAASSSLHGGCGGNRIPFRNLRNDNPSERIFQSPRFIQTGLGQHWVIGLLCNHCALWNRLSLAAWLTLVAKFCAVLSYCRYLWSH